MNTWKIIIEYNLQKIELILKTGSFSDAYIEAEKKYPGCKVISIKQVEEENDVRG